MKDVFELDDDYFTKPQKLGLKEVTAATRATFMALAGSLPRDEQAECDRGDPSEGETDAHLKSQAKKAKSVRPPR